jgi:pyruvate/2-oxoglutarate dehydrogenase complex dihydrolipoamide dehydrogenase (E3) component
VGEVAGSPHFTHISEDDFRVFADNVTGGNHVTTGRLVPFCLYIDPELARVGLSEKEAKAKGIAYRLFKAPMAAVLRAQALVETRGLLKALVAVDSDRILGFAGFGAGAGEVMSAVQIAMVGGVPYTALRDTAIAHPTLVEGLHSLFITKPTLSTDIADEQTLLQSA